MTSKTDIEKLEMSNVSKNKMYWTENHTEFLIFRQSYWTYSKSGILMYNIRGLKLFVFSTSVNVHWGYTSTSVHWNIDYIPMNWCWCIHNPNDEWTWKIQRVLNHVYCTSEFLILNKFNMTGKKWEIQYNFFSFCSAAGVIDGVWKI
jgi:hypothetical protein